MNVLHSSGITAQAEAFIPVPVSYTHLPKQKLPNARKLKITSIITLLSYFFLVKKDATKLEGKERTYNYLL